MSRKKMIAGNWKMNNTAAQSLALINDLKATGTDMSQVDVVVCPTFTSLNTVAQATAGTDIKVGAQNVHWAASGAFTAEISADMLKEVPVEYVIIGHSERRQYFGETDETVNQRTKAALAAGLKPIVCVGELLEEREGDQTKAVVKKQIEEGLAGLSAADMASVVVAYEPVWAIGTGLTASPEQAQEVHAFIRDLLKSLFGDVADSVRILYGGSMKPGNAAELLLQEDIDGGLIGGAALKAADFAALIESARA
jgi:triosephosphate isomerase